MVLLETPRLQTGALEADGLKGERKHGPGTRMQLMSGRSHSETRAALASPLSHLEYATLLWGLIVSLQPGLERTK